MKTNKKIIVQHNYKNPTKINGSAVQVDTQTGIAAPWLA